MKHNIVKFLIVLNTTIFIISLVVIYLRYSVFLEKFYNVEDKVTSIRNSLMESSTSISSTSNFVSQQQDYLSQNISTESVVISETKIRKPRFVYFSSKAKKVSLIGSFNDWNPQPMTKVGKNRWELVIEIPEGEYLYNFLVDGKIVLDTNNKNIALSPKGYKSSVLQLK